jgi:hypothetical protein
MWMMDYTFVVWIVDLYRGVKLDKTNERINSRT